MAKNIYTEEKKTDLNPSSRHLKYTSIEADIDIYKDNKSAKETFDKLSNNDKRNFFTYYNNVNGPKKAKKLKDIFK